MRALIVQPVRSAALRRGILPRIAVVLCALTFALGSLRAADKWSVAELLPPETLAVICARDTRTMVERFKQTGLWPILQDPGVNAAFKEQLGMAQRAVLLGWGEVFPGEKPTEMLQLLTQGEITLALIDAENIGQNGEPIPDLLLSLQVNENTKAFMDAINRRIDKFQADLLAKGATIGIAQANAGDAANTIVYTITAAEVPNIAISYALCDGNFLVTLGKGRIEKIAALHEKAKAGGLAQPAAAPEILGHAPSFMRAMEKAGKDADLLAYVNLAGIFANPLFAARPLVQKEREDMEKAGVMGIRSISFALGFSGKGVKEALFIDVPQEARKGIFALIDGESLDPTVLGLAPKNAVLAGAIKLAPDELFDNIIDLGTAFQGPQVRLGATAGLLFAGQQLRLDIRKELLENLSGLASFSVAMPARQTKLAVGMPQLLITLAVKDVELLKGTLKKLENAWQEKFEFIDTPVGDKEIVSIRERLAQPGKQPTQFSYVLDGNKLTFALYPLALKDELNRRAAGEKSSLLDDPDFQQVRASLASDTQGMLYADSAALLTAAYDTFIPILQLRERLPKIDETALPSAEVLAKNLCGSALGFNWSKDGVQIQAYSPTGIVTALPILAALAPRRAMQAETARMGEPVKPKEPPKPPEF